MSHDPAYKSSREIIFRLQYFPSALKTIETADKLMKKYQIT